MTKQINAGFNGSATSSEAVLWAAAEASRRGAHLRVISCYSIPVVPGAGFGLTASEAYTSILDETHGALAQMHSVIANAHPDLQVTTVASSDSAMVALVDLATADDLIVVGASCHHGGADHLLGEICPKSI